MGSTLLWLPLLLIIYTGQAQANHKQHENSLKQGNDGAEMGKTVYSMDQGAIFQDKLCKCIVHGQWKEDNPCLCAKFSRRKNRRVNWRKLCRGTSVKHNKKCRFFKKKKRDYGPVVPI